MDRIVAALHELGPRATAWTLRQIPISSETFARVWCASNTQDSAAMGRGVDATLPVIASSAVAWLWIACKFADAFVLRRTAQSGPWHGGCTHQWNMTFDVRTNTALNIHLLAALALTTALCSNACTGIVGASGGVGIVSSSGGAALSVGRTVNVHAEVGGTAHALTPVVGGELNLRDTPVSSHMGGGFSLGVLGATPSVVGLARFSVQPFGATQIAGASQYTFGAGAEISVGYLMLGQIRESHGALQGGGLLVTLSLRSDIEWRPAMQQSDVFVGLLAGISLPLLNR